MSGLCLEVAGATVRLAVAAFTLGWTHSVERTLWEEDWRVEAGGLVLVESRVQGSGAGMEPGPDARLEDGFFRFRPALPPLTELVLARSAEVADWRLCVRASCRELGRILPGADGPVTLRACDAQATGSNQSGVL